MKRDCGQGELIPIMWEVVSCKGMDDKETVSKFNLPIDAAKEFVRVFEELKNISYSNVRLYATDKQNYSNCILHENIK
jgi:hypothetical protein